jgi:hypothetical protein
MKQKSDWKRITLLRKTSFKKEIKILAGYKRLPGSNPQVLINAAGYRPF